MLHPTLLPTPTHPDAQALARRFAETLPRMLPVRLERRGELTEIVAK